MADPALMNSTAMSTPAPGITPAPEQIDSSEGQQATPEEQQQYDQFTAQVRNLIYDKKHPETTKMMVEALKSGDPIQALAHVALNAVVRVETAANQAGQKIDPAVLLKGGLEIVHDIADFSSQIADSQGTPKFTDEQIQKAYLTAVDLYRQMQAKAGTLDQGAAQQDLQQAAAADKQGNIDSVIPGASQAATALQPAAEAAANGDPNAGSTPPAGKPAPKPAAPKGKPKRKKRRK